MATTAKGTPYVESSNLVSAYPTSSLALATHIDANLAYNAATLNAQTGTTYTFVLADATLGKLVTASNASAQTYSVPPQSSVAWPTGSVIKLVNLGAGVLSIAAGSGVTVSGSSQSISQYQNAALIRTGSDAWTLSLGGGLPKASYSTNSNGTVDSASRPGKTIVTFTSSGSITAATAGLVEVLVIGGGGGGSLSNGGGGGAGGYVEDTTRYITAGAALTVTVGAGGPPGYNGNSSIIGTLAVAVGGGTGSPVSGTFGGSGGGATAASLGSPGTATVGQGNNGGTRVAGTAGGGGGGAGAVGANGATTVGGNGGAGTASTITGSSVTRAGGGGGAGSTGVGSGGTGGGGAGHASTGVNGSPNTGGGGGAAWSGTSGTGGNGFVAIVFG